MLLSDGTQNPALARLHRYWDERRGGRQFPARADIDPIEMRELLGNVLLVDVLREPLRFRIRLHGSRMVERAGYDMTGRMVDELPDTEFRELARRSFTHVAATGLPLLSRRDRVIDGRRMRYETLMLPLAADGRLVDMLLVGFVYLDR